MMQRSSRRGPDIVPDFGLWDEVRKTAAPLRHRKPKAAAVAGPPREVPPARAAKASVSNPAALAMRPLQPVFQAPGLTGLDRRTAQKLTRGKVAIDAKIDLHGLGVEEARHHLLQFLATARLRGHRTILVITGKGASPYAGATLHGRTHFDVPERQGRLRRRLPQWIAEQEFGQHVTGFQPAHPRHGGGGAFYVRLRRASRHRP